jgi:uncharacterized protein YhaN
MKINKLFLKAFGCFTDKNLDFSSQDRGLNIIFGPNEAGKSTAMRALNSFFFGFGHTSPDAYAHGYKDLAVGAVLETEQGRLVELTRYKRNKNDLVDMHEQPVDPGLMNTIMAGLTRDMYANMFGLDHQSLRLGSEEILKGGGHLGETLFAAASGITGLRLALEELKKRADELFTPRATSRPVWKNIQNISQLSKQLRQLSIRPEQWKQLQTGLERIFQEKEAAERQIIELESALNRHIRFQKALSLVSSHDNLKIELEELESVPHLNLDFARKRVEILTGLNRLKPELDRFYQLETDLEAELGKIKVCEKTLAFANEIERVYLKSTMVREARENISHLELEIRGYEGSLREKASLLSRYSSLENLKEFCLNQGEISRLEDLANELSSLKERLSQIERDIMEKGRDLDSTVSRLSDLSDIPDRKKLDMISRQLVQASDLVEQQNLALEREKKLESTAQKSIRSLGLWQGTLEEIHNLALPLQETIDRFEEDMFRSAHNLESAQKELLEQQELISGKKKTLAGIEHSDALPKPEELPKARTLRDHGWKLIKSAWLDKKENQLETRKFLTLTESASLANGFEKSMSLADEQADILLKNADQVAARSTLIDELKGLEEKYNSQEKAYESAARKNDKIREEWVVLWSELKIDPLSPREMSAWISRVHEIRRIGDELDNERLNIQKTDERLGNLMASSREALAEAGISFSENADLSTLCMLVDDALDKISMLVQTRANLEHDQKKLKSSLDKLVLRKKELTCKFENTKAQWTRILAGTAFDPSQAPSEALKEIRLIREIQAGQAQIGRWIDQKNVLEKKCREFSGMVIRLLKNLKYDREEEGKPEDVIGRIYMRLKKEQDKFQQYIHLQENLDQVKEKIASHHTELKILKGALEMICREAGVDDPGDLPGIEEKSRRKKELLVKLEHVLDKLMDLSSGEDLINFIDKAKDFDPDGLQATISKLENQKRELEIQRESILKEKHDVESQIKQMDGTSKALEVEQQINEQKALLEDNVEQYVRLRLAGDILAAAIERYRAANQGPVLKMAGEIFREITLKSFSAISADYDEKGEPVIKAVRETEERLGVEELSDGSRDQLFLALRLGGIYRYLDRNPPFPFLVDDILVHFDDERSRKTLSILAQLAQKTQVLFFTHHRHLKDLALQIPENDMVKVHELAKH